MEAMCKIGAALIIVVVFQLFVGVESGVNVNTRSSRGRFFSVGIYLDESLEAPFLILMSDSRIQPGENQSGGCRKPATHDASGTMKTDFWR